MCIFVKTIWTLVATFLKTVCYCCTCALQTLCCMVFIVVIICLAIALGVYFGVFHNRDSDSGTTTTTTPSSALLRALLPEGMVDEKEPAWVY